ncbi:MAG: hypothetical protein IKQ04_07800 [Oscillospiraceae bacterium]|nr:hypothetical protein [Oscillospiraceae bacterium]
MARQKNKAIRQRAWSRADAGLPDLSQEELEGVAKWRDYLFEDLGILIGEGDAIPSTNGVPRIFVLQADDNGREHPLSLDAAGLAPGSPEFWRQVQLGSVYAFPAGQRAPVQLQLEQNEQDRAVLGYSAPVSKDSMPATPAKPLGFWKSVAWFFTGGYAFRRQRRAYKQRDVSNVTVREELGNMASKRANCAKAEQQAVRERQALLAEQKRQQKIPDMLRESRKKLGLNQIGLSRMTKLFKPVPEYDPKLDMSLPENHGRGLYHKELFDQHLTPFGKDQIDLERIQVGSSGQHVTDEEFAAVVMYTLWNPRFSIPGNIAMNGDPYLADSLRALGCAEKDLPMLITAQTRAFYTSDLFIPDARENGDVCFQAATNPARHAAVAAMKDYQAGSKDKLAQIIADGVNMAAGDLLAMLTFPLDDQARANFEMSEKLLGLLDRDPELKELCGQKGMEPQRLKTVEGMRKMLGLVRQANQAEVQLGEAAQAGTQLSREQRHELAKTMLKSRISMLLLKEENEADQPLHKQMADQLIDVAQYVELPVLQQWEKGTLQRPAPADGKMWSDSMEKCRTTFQVVYRSQPKCVQALATEAGQQELDRLADQIVRQQGLADMPLSELYLTISPKYSSFNLSSAIVQANAALHPQQPQAQQPQPQVQQGSPQIHPAQPQLLRHGQH